MTKCREIKRCHECEQLKEAYSHQTVRCYEQMVEWFYCKEHTTIVPPELEPEPVVVVPRVIQPTGKPKRIQSASKVKFLKEQEIAQSKTTVESIALGALDAQLTARAAINRKIEKKWGKRVRPKDLTKALSVLVAAKAVERTGDYYDERNACYSLTGAEYTPPKPKPEKIEAKDLKLMTLRKQGFSILNIVLTEMTQTPVLRSLINAEIARKYGGRLPSADFTKVLNTLVNQGKIERFGTEERYAHYSIAKATPVNPTEPIDNEIRVYPQVQARAHPYLQPSPHRTAPRSASAHLPNLQPTHS